MDPANRFAKSNRQIELPNGFGKPIRQMDPANRLFESPIRFGKSNCRIAKANSNRQIDSADQFGKKKSNCRIAKANSICQMDLADRFAK
jgi:hypothetical protein